MAARVLPNIGLTAYWPLGDDTWKDGMDANLFALSILGQLVADEFVTGEPAGVQGKVVLTEASNQIGIYDAGAWHYLTAKEGWRAWVKSEDALYVCTGAAWTVVTAGGGGGAGLPPGGAPGEVLVKSGPDDGDADWGSVMGAPGRNPEFRASGGYLQYRLVGDTDWTNLIALSALGGLPALAGNANKVLAVNAGATDVEWRTPDANGVPLVTSALTAYTPNLAAANKYIRLTAADPTTFTVPRNLDVAYPVGTTLTVEQAGAGAVNIAPGSGVTLRYLPTMTLNVAGRYSVVQLVQVAANEWTVFGALEPL